MTFFYKYGLNILICEISPRILHFIIYIVEILLFHQNCSKKKSQKSHVHGSFKKKQEKISGFLRSNI